MVHLLPCSSQGARAWETEALPPRPHTWCEHCATTSPYSCCEHPVVLSVGQGALGLGQWGHQWGHRLCCGQNCGLAVPILLTCSVWELWEGTGLAVCSESAWGALLELCQQQPQPGQLTTGLSLVSVLLSHPLCPCPLPLLPAVDNEEAALLHEEATMTIEELLTRYGQNCTKNLKAKSVAAAGDNAVEGTGKQHDGESNMNGEAEPGELPDHKERKNGKPDEEITGISSTSDKASAGGNSPALQKPELGKGDEAVTSSTGEAGPSCSSTGKPQRTTKSKFFEDSEDESDEVEEEEEDSEECSEDEDGYSSEEAENEDDEDDTEEAEEDEDEEEEMLLPGMEGKEEPGSDSGTTAVVALIRGKQLIVANAGDSRCVVSEGGKAVDMSYDHKPEDEVELARIKNAGGKVTMDGRVNGGLNLSRAIGDHFYKRNKNLPPEEQMISALPDIKVLTINDDHDFMVIACDGIWNVMSSQEVVDFIQSKITQKDENGVLRPLSSIVEELLDQCLAPDTSGDGTGCDNMTCIIISFKPRNTHPPAESGKRKLGEAAAPAEENGGDSTKKAKLE
uniref:protein-serine/threonine phosphatase n=1 Tax=Cyanoderma ruficeps TaxID=181631 RepID=A0A8C3RHM1_9PASS